MSTLLLYICRCDNETTLFAAVRMDDDICVSIAKQPLFIDGNLGFATCHLARKLFSSLCKTLSSTHGPKSH